MKFFNEMDPSYDQLSHEDKLAYLEDFLKDPGFDLEAVRSDFSYLKRKGDPIAYLDNAATSQRPDQVIDAVADYYKYENANPLRGNHILSVLSTQAYEGARETIKDFINAKEKEEVVYTRNASEGLNLLAYLAGIHYLKEGDEVLITGLEHHSNQVPWQFACQESGAKLVYVELDDDYGLDMEDLKDKLNDRTKIVSFSGASNVLASLPDAKEIIRLAHERGAIAILDGAQLAPHARVDVQDLDVDFMAFSGHKMLAPFGVGILYGKADLLEKLPPFLYGGEMIEYVQDQTSTFAELPYKFEAGTQNVGGAVGLEAAIKYMEDLGVEKIASYEKALTEYAFLKLEEEDDLDIYHPQHGPRGTALAFNIKGAHPHDVSTILDSVGVSIRSGHHCTQPLHRRLGISASCRASFAFYNTKEEVDRLVAGLDEVRDIMGLDQ